MTGRGENEAGISNLDFSARPITYTRPRQHTCSIMQSLSEAEKSKN